MSASLQRLAAHAAGETFHVEDQAGNSHDHLAAADPLHASGALNAKDPLVIGSTVKLEVTYETGLRQRRGACRTGEALLVIVSFHYSHHVLIRDRTPASSTDRFQ